MTFLSNVLEDDGTFLVAIITVLQLEQQNKHRALDKREYLVIIKDIFVTSA